MLSASLVPSDALLAFQCPNTWPAAHSTRAASPTPSTARHAARAAEAHDQRGNTDRERDVRPGRGRRDPHEQAVHADRAFLVAELDRPAVEHMATTGIVLHHRWAIGSHVVRAVIVPGRDPSARHLPPLGPRDRDRRSAARRHRERATGSGRSPASGGSRTRHAGRSAGRAHRRSRARARRDRCRS